MLSSFTTQGALPIHMAPFLASQVSDESANSGVPSSLSDNVEPRISLGDLEKVGSLPMPYFWHQGTRIDPVGLVLPPKQP